MSLFNVNYYNPTLIPELVGSWFGIIKEGLSLYKGITIGGHLRIVTRILRFQKKFCTEAVTRNLLSFQRSTIFAGTLSNT